jgi:hypothetical protein
VDADHWFAERAQSLKAGVAEFEAELIFAFCVKGVMAFVASGVRRALALFPDMNFRMDFERVHDFSPVSVGACEMPSWGICFRLQGKDLALVGGLRLCESSQGSCRNAQGFVLEWGGLAATFALETLSTNRKLGERLIPRKREQSSRTPKRGVADWSHSAHKDLTCGTQ